MSRSSIPTTEPVPGIDTRDPARDARLLRMEADNLAAELRADNAERRHIVASDRADRALWLLAESETRVDRLLGIIENLSQPADSELVVRHEHAAAEAQA